MNSFSAGAFIILIGSLEPNDLQHLAIAIVDIYYYHIADIVQVNQ